MKTLLDDQFAPFTRTFGFVERPFGVVAKAYVRWNKRIRKRFTAKAIRGSLADALAQLAPVTQPSVRALLMETASNWTACFDNSILGGSSIDSTCSHLPRVLGCRSVQVDCQPDHLRWVGEDEIGSRGSVAFTLCGPEDTEWLNVIRFIQAARDLDRWVFNELGEVQPYEQVERYKARRIRDRFTAEMLEQYCAALGIRLFDPSFYGPRGLLATYDTFYAARTLTLDEAQRELDLPRP